MTNKMMREIEEVVGPAWLRKRIIELIYDRQRDIVEIISQVHPMYSDNLFRRLRDAVSENGDVEQVLREIKILSDDIPQEVREKLLDIVAILSAFSDVLGGDVRQSTE